jgi:hypothetical protein
VILAPTLNILAPSGGIDPLVRSFQIATGATDLLPLNNLITYVRGEGLLNNFRLYPQKSSQNYGTGSTVEGIGSLTANNITLVGSPTWGTDGIAMNSSTQYSEIADFLGAETITVFIRRTDLPTSGGFVGGQWNFSDDRRSWSLAERAAGVDEVVLLRNSVGDNNAANSEFYVAGANTFIAADATYVAQWVAGGGRSFFRNNTGFSLSLVSPNTAQTSRLNAPDPIVLNCALGGTGPASFAGGTYKAFAIVNSVTPTTTQRQTLVNLINAL